MQLIIASNIGFCFGVERAIEIARSAASERGRVYTAGELIHNRRVVERLRDEGIVPCSSIKDELKKGDTLIIRSHGVPPSVLELCEGMGVCVIDATCPFVKKIHDLVDAASRDGYHVVITGKRDHPEVVGISARCQAGCDVITSVEELDALDLPEKTVLVSQTTFSSEAFADIAGRLSELRPSAELRNTICVTTANRQAEAIDISKRCDTMIIVGDRSSSNTKKLTEMCSKYCRKALSIENECELSLEIAQSDDIIGLVAGASTPERIIREVLQTMSELEKNMTEIPETEKGEVEAAVVSEPAVEAAEVAAPADGEGSVTEPSVVPESVSGEEAEAAAEPEEAQGADGEEPQEASDDKSDNFAEAFEKTLVRIKNGQILTGSVVQIVDGEVCVNIGYKSDGFIPRNEFSSDPEVDPNTAVKIGDSIEVEVLKVNDGEGNVLLSRKNVESKLAWEKMLTEMEDETRTFDAVGKEVVKGGLIASIEGMRAFVPASLLSTKYVENIAEFVGQPMRLRVIEVDKTRKRIVASQKAVLMAEAEAARKEKWQKLVVGSRMSGVVRRLTDFGAFVDIGGIDGLVHVTDVAWGHVKHTSDILKIGQEIEVLVLNVDVEKERVSLGYKQLQPKPWTKAEENYPVGSVVEGKVVRIVPFGAFIALEPTIDGLIHISQIGVRRTEKIENEINVGDMVRCKVLDVNAEAKRISLSRREVLLEENPELAEELAQEKAERERLAAERAEQRAAAFEQQKQQRQTRTSEPAERPARPVRSEPRPERAERRPRREDADYELPPVQQATTSLAELFSGYNAESEDK